MIIMGIDPGIARIGWAVLTIRGGTISKPSYGCITTPKDDSLEKRLLDAHRQLLALCNKYHPQDISIEELYFSKNTKTAIIVGEARGVVLLTAAQCGARVISYSPLVVKQAVCGSGSADKIQVQKMVTRLLRLPDIPQPDDVADALAIALTHAYSYKYHKQTT